ncbi:polysaccharide biosynthesis tyrosine autokinase [Gordonia rubripertincta]|uniref:non-specific protein-tyrosine kinase n=1 Tax=Gordonia rubripertincta TaxID=36822 RepID=A0AAW6RCW1_GORRU|nr:polysaccharide biosynthesis tyrosine autokinase [Gordonia rubripertincta]MDG6783819.1 polysaccharide biosynthesis tyrosine autokinase [Gordonia rubripertincta]
MEARDTNREHAYVLANAVADSLVAYVASLEEPAAGGVPLAKLTVVTPASIAESPVSPRTYRNVALGFLLGAFLGVLLILARARFDTKVRSTDDLEILELPALGVIPRDTDLEGRGALDFSVGSSVTAEAYRSLRTNLSFSNVDAPVKVIIVTSPSSGEGKTTTAINLAAALAEAGNRVVIVDADLRRPTLALRLSLNGEVGLTTYLAGSAQLSDLVQETGMSDLDALSSGSLPPTPAELLGSQRAGLCFSELASIYDYVVIDSPPVLPVTDAVVLTQWADGVLLVARAGRTTRPNLTAATENLSKANATPIGVVLNDASSSSGAYSYAYYGESRESELV